MQARLREGHIKGPLTLKGRIKGHPTLNYGHIQGRPVLNYGYRTISDYSRVSQAEHSACVEVQGSWFQMQASEPYDSRFRVSYSDVGDLRKQRLRATTGYESFGLQAHPSTPTSYSDRMRPSIILHY